MKDERKPIPARPAPNNTTWSDPILERIEIAFMWAIALVVSAILLFAIWRVALIVTGAQ